MSDRTAKRRPRLGKLAPLRRANDESVRTRGPGPIPPVEFSRIIFTTFFARTSRRFAGLSPLSRAQPPEASELATSSTPSDALVPEPCRSGDSGSSGYTFPLGSGPRTQGPEPKQLFCGGSRAFVYPSPGLSYGPWRGLEGRQASVIVTVSVTVAGSLKSVRQRARNTSCVAGVRPGETRTSLGSRSRDLDHRRQQTIFRVTSQRRLPFWDPVSVGSLSGFPIAHLHSHRVPSFECFCSVGPGNTGHLSERVCFSDELEIIRTGKEREITRVRMKLGAAGRAPYPIGTQAIPGGL